MHFEFLVEGACEKTTLSIIMPQILGEYGAGHTWLIHKHRGVGSLPCLTDKPKPYDQSLLGQLPAKIRAYAEVNQADQCVVVLMDLDDKDKNIFRAELGQLNCVYPDLALYFCFAIEELEAWFLGDVWALEQAYPDYDRQAFADYQQDGICGTWEYLARCVDKPLLGLAKRDRRILNAKIEWSRRISKHLLLSRNRSLSLQYFKNTLLGALTDVSSGLMR